MWKSALKLIRNLFLKPKMVYKTRLLIKKKSDVSITMLFLKSTPTILKTYLKFLKEHMASYCQCCSRLRITNCTAVFHTCHSLPVWACDGGWRVTYGSQFRLSYPNSRLFHRTSGLLEYNGLSHSGKTPPHNLNLHRKWQDIQIICSDLICHCSCALLKDTNTVCTL